jgi:hypothetical protein
MPTGRRRAPLDLPGEPGDRSDARLLAEAESLDVAWREILSREIALARARRRYRDAESDNDVLWQTLVHLPNALLPPPPGAVRGRGVGDVLLDPDWITYTRVLELENLARAAEKLGEPDEPAGWRLRRKTGCAPEDARWALSRAAAPPRERGRALDDAVARARAEGLELPPGASGIDAMRRIQRLLRRRLGIVRRRARPAAP